MSASYYIYTEAFLDGKWVCICPYIKKLKDDDNNKLVLSETLWSGSRSYFSNTYDKIQQDGYSIKYEDLSDEIKKIHEYDEKWHYPIIYGMNYETLVSLTPPNDKKEYCEYVPKSAVSSYENEGTEIWDYLHIDDYRKLPEDEKGYYQLYEWDDEMGWQTYFKDILKRVNYTINIFDNVNYFALDNVNIRIVMIAYP